MGKRLQKIFLAVVIFVLVAPVAAGAAPTDPVPLIRISEVQVANEEFIELYNSSDAAVTLTGWRLEYRSSAQASSWTTKLPTMLSGEILPHGSYVVALASHLPNRNVELTTTLANTGGHVRLIKPAGGESSEMVMDLVGWGSAESPEQLPAAAPKAGFSIQRCHVAGLITDTDNNAADFAEVQPTSPGTVASCSEPPAEDPPAIGGSCEGIVVSELLPNAEGSDTGQEFIELYNPAGEDVDLTGCGLQLAGETSIFRFSGQMITAGQYLTFSDTQTGITLPNSSGGTIYLLSAVDEELQAVSYPAELADDVSWAWFGGDQWEQTFMPTPGAENIEQLLEPCATGQVRSEESGRCVSAESDEANGLKPCSVGQERNPETNRCRSSAALASTLAACKAGQERNPETNRCRAVASAASQLKPCSPGQERNPETNRCRKIAGTSSDSDNKVKDVEAATSSTTGWWLVGITATGAAGYGLWEWRRDIAGFVSRLGRKVTSTAQ